MIPPFLKYSRRLSSGRVKPRDDAGNDPGTKRKGRLCMITHHADSNSIAYSARVVKKKTGFYMEKTESPE